MHSLTQAQESSALAPVALFVFKRPEHTRRTLESLSRNPDFLQSPLYVFCDGPRRIEEEAEVVAVRDVVRAFNHPAKTLIESESNTGLARSIVSGVTKLCQEYGRAIVVEDDLIVSDRFLEYMNWALATYQNDERVMQVSGHMFPVQLSERLVFLPFTTSWGWATWSRSWQAFCRTDVEALADSMRFRDRIRFDLGGAYPYYRMLRNAMAGKKDSWAIRWYLAVFMAHGLVLFPGESLVLNDGFDGSGINCPETKTARGQLSQVNQMFEAIPVAESIQATQAVARYLSKERGALKRLVDWALRIA